MTIDDREPLLISGVVLDAPDAHTLGAFYQAFLGWDVQHEDEGWIKLQSPHGGAGLAFQSDPGFVRPMWPGAAGEQRMMAHLDIRVDGLDAEVARAVSLGATLAPVQPQVDVRVLIDPVGHPFCLWDPNELQS